MPSTLFTNLGNPVQASWLNEADTAVFSWLTSVAGTPDAITAAGPDSLTAIAAGQAFRFLPAADNTGISTLTINGLPAQPIVKSGTSQLTGGDLQLGVVAEVVYDGSFFQLINPAPLYDPLPLPIPVIFGGTGATTASDALSALGAIGRLIGFQIFTAGATYTPTAGTTRILCRGLGGGGAGGGCAATGVGQVSIGGGGGAGASGESLITSGFAGAGVVIGSAGTGVVGAAGNPGTATTFLGISFGGGGGGGPGLPGAQSGAGQGAGGTATGANILNFRGASGFPGMASFLTLAMLSGQGASSPYGGGGPASIANNTIQTVGTAATGFGSGGGGAASGASQGAIAGGAGSPGYLIIFEFS